MESRRVPVQRIHSTVSVPNSDPCPRWISIVGRGQFTFLCLVSDPYDARIVPKMIIGIVLIRLIHSGSLPPVLRGLNTGLPTNDVMSRPEL